jgi:hypothetical protein
MQLRKERDREPPSDRPAHLPTSLIPTLTSLPTFFCPRSARNFLRVAFLSL